MLCRIGFGNNDYGDIDAGYASIHPDEILLEVASAVQPAALPVSFLKVSSSLQLEMELNLYCLLLLVLNHAPSQNLLKEISRKCCCCKLKRGCQIARSSVPVPCMGPNTCRVSERGQHICAEVCMATKTILQLLCAFMPCRAFRGAFCKTLPPMSLIGP